MIDVSIDLPVIWKWGKRVGFSVLDQGLFSGANFLLYILLARWLAPDEYGAFAIAFSIFLFLAGFQNALIMDPMAVFGPTKYVHKQENYIQRMFVIQFCLDLFLSIILIGIGFLFGSPTKYAVIGLGLCSPFLLSMWFSRTAFYIKSTPLKAALTSLVYGVVLDGGLIFIKLLGTITLEHLFFILIIASMAGISVAFLLQHKGKINNHNIFSVRDLISESWQYGKWIGLSTASHGIAFLLFIPLIGKLVGLHEAAVFKGWQNLITPMQQFLSAIGLLIVPILSKQLATRDNPSKLFSKTFFISVIPTCFYIVLFILLSDKVVIFLYNQQYFLSYTWLKFGFSLYLFLIALNTSFYLFLRARQNSKLIFFTKTWAAASFILFLPFIICRPSFNALFVGLLLISTIESIVLVLCFFKKKSLSINAEKYGMENI